MSKVDSNSGTDFLKWMLGPDYLVSPPGRHRPLLECCPFCEGKEVDLLLVEDDSVTFECDECGHTWDELKP